jgi:hypothetical protein
MPCCLQAGATLLHPLYIYSAVLSIAHATHVRLTFLLLFFFIFHIFYFLFNVFSDVNYTGEFLKVRYY